MNLGVDFLIFCFGEESPWNLAGKIVLAPFMILAGLTLAVVGLLFMKRQ